MRRQACGFVDYENGVHCAFVIVFCCLVTSGKDIRGQKFPHVRKL